MASRRDGHELILEDQWSPLVLRGFQWYVRRLLRKRFFAVRISRSGLPNVEAWCSGRGPLLLLLNHSSWWDPILLALLQGVCCPDRRVIAAMDRVQLERFTIFRRMGVFGIDPDDPASLPALVDHVHRVVMQEPRTIVMLTPQGRFTDVREPMRLRPGAAALAARLPDVRALSVSLEYPFWLDAKPEVLMRFCDVQSPEVSSTAAWQRALTAAMQANADALAAESIARDPSGFDTLLGGGVARVNPFYDLWLRMTGRGTAIDESGRSHRSTGGVS
jgi:1-acyl-sn-glycerol-3-phosphate acyltransferase